MVTLPISLEVEEAIPISSRSGNGHPHFSKVEVVIFKIEWEVAIPISYKGVGNHPISKVDVSTPWAIHSLKRWGMPPTLKV